MNLTDAIMSGIIGDITLDQEIKGLKKRLEFLGYKYDEETNGPILPWIDRQKQGADETTKSLLSLLAVSVVQLIMSPKK